MTSTSRALCVVLLTALAVWQAVAARPLADEQTQIVLKTLEGATRLSGALDKATAILDPSNYKSKYHRVVALLNAIVYVIKKANTLDAESHKLTTFEDADVVVDALTRFVKALKLPLDTLIYKDNVILSKFPPSVKLVREALVKLNDVVGTFAPYLIGVIPSDQKSAAEAQFGSLTKTLTLAVSTYSRSSGFADH